MNYIVLDLEWNQAAYKVDSEEDLPFEIIEIGAVKMDEDGTIQDEFQALIRPQVYPFLVRRTREITGWTDDDLDEKGIYFEEACDKFLKWCGANYTFCLWGTGDLTQFERNMDYYKLRIPWKYPFRYLDVQKLFALQENEGKTKRTLESAVEYFGLPMERPFHHAVDDAFYTAKIFQKIDREKYGIYFSTDYFQIPKNRFEEITFSFPTYSKYVSRRFNLKEEAVKNHRVREMPCRICGRKMKAIIPWFTEGRTYLAVMQCKEHGRMRGRLRIKMTEHCAGYFVIRTIKSCTDEEYEAIRKKREAVTVKRREKRKSKRRAANN